MTPWEFECYTQGWAKAKYRGLVTLLRGLGESMTGMELQRSLCGEESIPSQEGDDEVLAISAERAYRAMLKNA